MTPRNGRGPKTPPEQAPGQLGLFGPDPAGVPAQRTTSTPGTSAVGAESNDMDLITTIAGNASRGLYVLVGPNERVYVRTDGPDGRDVARVPRYEEAAVHQLLRRGWLNPGGHTKDLGCGAATLTGTAVNCPASTRARVQRWNVLSRPPAWTGTPPASGAAARPRLRVVPGEQS
jgi:hypothetical protein